MVKFIKNGDVTLLEVLIGDSILSVKFGLLNYSPFRESSCIINFVHMLLIYFTPLWIQIWLQQGHEEFIFSFIWFIISYVETLHFFVSVFLRCNSLM